MTPHHPQRDAKYWIEHLELTRHPEGGWFRESYRCAETAPARGLPDRFGGPRSFCTAIYFLLERGDISALHRLKSDEIWHFYEGDPLAVHVIDPRGESFELLLGRDAGRGERLQAVVPAGCWFGAESRGNFSLVGCTVSPGFDFSDFQMAGRTELTGLFPHRAGLIERLTRP